MKRSAIFTTAFAVYAALMAAVWAIGTRQARNKTDAQLDYAILDFRSTIGGAIDTMLGYAADAVIRHFKEPGLRSPEEMQEAARHFDLDEINIVDEKGRIISSNDPACMGVDMNKKPETAEFIPLLRGVPCVSQPFRKHAYDTTRRKYLGKPFPGGKGFIQIGLDENRLAKMLPGILGYIFDQWLLGRTGFFLCADATTGKMISNPSRHLNEASTLTEAGFDEAAASPFEICDDKSPGETFTQTLFGEKCYCRNYLFGGHRFIPALPEHEYYDTRTAYISIFGVLLAAAIGAFAFFAARIFRDSARLKAFYAQQEANRAKEMEIAKTIQTAALPSSLPDDPNFHMTAETHPARDVGGDFYDFFTTADGRLAFLVADVSGKGVSAALYMMTAKAIIKNALATEGEPAAAFTKANAELCRGNSANMFLTAWAGMLDLESGEVVYANAGHNPPAIMRRGGATVELLTERSGPMLAIMDGVAYKQRSARLEPGDTLFLYTDGVTEAQDAKGALFGDDRLDATLKTAPSGDPAAVCGHVRLAVAAFAAGAPQADDITMLAVERLRPPLLFIRSFGCSKAEIAATAEFLDACFGKPGTEEFQTALPAMHVIMDEIVSNIVHHSGATGFQVDVKFSTHLHSVKMVFTDDGAPYDPLTHRDPDTTLPAEKRPIGGLGILMVKKMSDSVSYMRMYNRNILTVVKSVHPPAAD